MQQYQKTLWENNKTIIDAEKLNKLEEQTSNLTLALTTNQKKIDSVITTLDTASKDIETIQTTMVNKANENAIEELKTQLKSVSNEMNTLKSELDDLKIKTANSINDISLDKNKLNFYSNGTLIKTIELPKSESNTIAACDMFKCDELSCS